MSGKKPKASVGRTGKAKTVRAKKQRADRLLLERGMVASRSKAQALIMAGDVFCGEQRVEKAGSLLDPSSPLRLRARRRFVSRGGDKLLHALTTFAADGLRVEGRVCLDVGASTGGFSDCLLQHGATRIYAVDVGYGQLHPKLRDDPRVDVRERTNARNLQAADFEEGVELVVVDASFIGIGKLIDAIARVVAPGGELVALVKPQFEAGRQAVAQARGVIRDEAVRSAAIDGAHRAIEDAGFEIVAACDSAVHGPKGNVEAFAYARREQ